MVSFGNSSFTNPINSSCLEISSANNPFSSRFSFPVAIHHHNVCRVNSLHNIPPLLTPQFPFLYCCGYSFFGCTRFCINTCLLCIIVQYSGFIQLVSCYHNSLCVYFIKRFCRVFYTSLIVPGNHARVQNSWHLLEYKLFKAIPTL